MNDIVFIKGSLSNCCSKIANQETGAKVRVCGTKADSQENVEISPSDGNGIHGAYEELFVHVSADTYEKVDAAIALIELLVSVNPAASSTTSTAVSGDNVNVIDLSQGTPAPYTVPSAVVNQGVAQPIMGSAPAPPPGLFQRYPGPWYSTGPPQTPLHPPSGFITPANPSAPLLSNPVRVSSTPFNPSNLPSLFGPRPVLAAGFTSVPQNSFFPSISQPQFQVLQHPFMPQAPSLGHNGPPRNPPMAALISLPSQPNISAPPPFSGNQTAPTGPPQVARPVVSSLPQSASLAAFPDRPLTPSGSSIRWPLTPAGTPTSLGPSNMSTLMSPPQGHHPVASQPINVSGGPPLNIPASNMISPISRPSSSQSFGAAANHPNFAPAFASVPQPQVGFSTLIPTQSPAPIASQSSSMVPVHPVVERAAVPNLSPNTVFGSAPIPSPVTSISTPPSSQLGIPSSVSGSAPTFTPLKSPSVSIPKPQHPSSSDFTFQPHRSQSPAQVVPRPASQLVPHIVPPMNQTMNPPQAALNLSFRPAMHNSNPIPELQDFPRPQVSNQVSRPRAPMSITFAGTLTGPPAPVRNPGFPNPSLVVSTTPAPQMRNFSPAPQMINSAGPSYPRLGNPVPLQQNYLGTAPRPQCIVSPNQQFRGNLSFPYAKPSSSPSGGQQSYDPFSPTSVSVNPLLGADPAKVRKQESDPEYDDLMASVGVK
ncbi:unnamed protein product [Ilex paraguariensis]|uniref:Uncharacterized protein n=1 Tax=Ilex paraguariensis TaxID=185542 RepID=A0ABC8S2Q7_9AQUA